MLLKQLLFDKLYQKHQHIYFQTPTLVMRTTMTKSMLVDFEQMVGFNIPLANYVWDDASVMQQHDIGAVFTVHSQFMKADLPASH